MKATRNHTRSRSGYVTLLMVISTGLVVLLLLLAAFRVTLRTQEHQMVVQMRVDASQREAAVLRALVNIVPNRAIYAMRSGSALAPDPAEWETIFRDALIAANAEDADADGIAAALGATVAANPMAFDSSDVASIFSALNNESGVVSPGVNRSLGSGFPPHLLWAGSGAAADAVYPIITFEKVYGAHAAGTAELSTTTYPLFNRIPYPNIRFGYANPGDPFVAKRNWWAFSIRYPSDVPGLGDVVRRYVLSIYEVPSQLPLSASSALAVGRHADGTQWSGVTIDGGVFGEHILSEASFGVERMASRRATDIDGGAMVGGTAISHGFQSTDAALSHEIQHSTHFPVSVAAGSGRVAFIPINRGIDFYTLPDAGADVNALSPTGWNEYSRGAAQCAMSAVITEVATLNNQEPVKVQFNYLRGDGTPEQVVFDRDLTWPRPGQVGAETMPFQTETTETGRVALTVHLDRMRDWLAANNGGVPLVNHSLAINPDPNGTHVVAPSFPSNSQDTAVVLRGGGDMSAYIRGFALVTNLRVFFADDLNTVQIPAPAGSGLSGMMSPPVAVLAPEQRWGVTAQPRQIEFSGVLGSVDAGGGAARPLDLRSGGDQLVPANIDAQLRGITSPAQLPPVSLMNWLVTIEEVSP